MEKKNIDYEQLTKNYQQILTKRNKECYLEKEKYILNSNNMRKEGSKIFRCKHYKDTSIKWKDYCTFDINNKLIDANTEHSCVVDDKAVQSLKISNEAKTIISTNEDILNLKEKDLFATSLKKAKKRKFDDIDDDEKDENK